MAAPIISSVVFDKTSYSPGDKITATATYSDPNPTSNANTNYTLTATVTDSVTGETGNGTGTFTVSSPVANALSATASGGQPGQAWSVASDNHTTQAVLTAVAQDPANPNPMPPPAKTTWTTSANKVGQTWGGFIFYNNGFNTAEVGPETIWLGTPSQPFTWGIVSQQSTATPHVKAYPCAQLNCDIPAGNLTSALSSWMEGGPAYTGGLYSGPQNGIDYETAWDIWTAGNAHEIMIWTRNAGQTPLGTRTATPVTIAGVAYDVWTANTTISYVAQQPFATAAGYDLSLFIKDAVQRSFFPATEHVTQFCFGWEICQTNNQPLNFSCSNFTLQLQHS